MVFVAILLGFFGLAGVVEALRERRGVRARVSAAAGVGTATATGDDSGEDKGVVAYLRDRVLSMIRKLGEANEMQQADGRGSPLAQRLVSAGYRRETASSIFTGLKALFAFVVPLVTWALPIPALDQGPVLRSLFVYVLLAGAGLYGPEIWLQQVSEARKTKITNGFPDALDLLVVCIEAGLGLDAAISRTGAELALAHPDLCDELQMVTLELRAGLPRSQALQNLAWRTDLTEVKSLVALLIQTDRFGTSVGQALRVHADAMRKSRTQRAEEMAGKLPVKLLFPLMFFIFPVIFIVILGPAIIQGMRVLLPTLGGGQ